MDTATTAALAGCLAYLCGSIPFGLIIARVAKGIDIRTVGSGNIGATNVARMVGAKWGVLVLICDALKGLLPTLFIPMFLVPENVDDSQHIAVTCGIATILGHMFPCWLKFRGGKGVATALGVVIILGWQASIAAAATFLLVYVATRYVALASMIGSIAYAATQFWLLGSAAFSATNWSTAAFSVLIPVLIIVRHRSNIVRLLKGEEAKMTFKRDGT